MTEPYYQDESVTLYHGNCLEINEWLTADVLVTDPPYGMRHAPRGSYDPVTGITHKPRGSESIAGDDSIDLRDAVLRRWYDRPWVVFGTWRVPRPPATDHRLIWHKTGAPPGPARSAFMLQDEEIYIHGKGFRATSPPLRSVIVTDEMRSGAAGAVAKIGHPTPKPLRLMEILIDRCPMGVIADPFAGSGSTLIAARNQGRKAIGVELEERYCELIATRLAQGCLDKMIDLPSTSEADKEMLREIRADMTPHRAAHASSPQDLAELSTADDPDLGRTLMTGSAWWGVLPLE